MVTMTMTSWKRGLRAIALGGLVAGGACKKNPVDTALEAALDFDGVFEATDGTQIQMNADGSATVKKVGSSALTSPLQVGKTYMYAMVRQGPGEYRGYVVDKTGLLDWGDVSIHGSALTISRQTSAPVGQISWQKIASGPGTPNPDPGNGNGNPPSGSTCQSQWGTVIQGKWNISSYAFGSTEYMGYNYTSATFEFGTTSYTRRATGRFGADPVLTGTYVINSDANANLIGSNRCSIRITYSNGFTVYKIQKYAGGSLTLVDNGDPNVPITVIMAK